MCVRVSMCNKWASVCLLRFLREVARLSLCMHVSDLCRLCYCVRLYPCVCV